MQILPPLSTFFPDTRYIKATIVPSDNIEASVDITIIEAANDVSPFNWSANT